MATRADTALIQGAAQMYGAEAQSKNVAAKSFSQGFASTYFSTVDKIQEQQRLKALAEEERRKKELEQFNKKQLEIQDWVDKANDVDFDYSKLTDNQVNQYLEFGLKTKKEITRLMSEAQQFGAGEEGRLIREQKINVLLSNVRNSAAELGAYNEKLISNRDSVSEGLVSDANGIVNPSNSDKMGDAIMRSNSFGLDDRGRIIDQPEDYILKAIDVSDEFVKLNAKLYDNTVKSGQGRDGQYFNETLRRYYNKSLTDDKVLSLMFDELEISGEGGYYDSNNKEQETYKKYLNKDNWNNENKADMRKSYAEAVDYFKKIVVDKLVQGAEAVQANALSKYEEQNKANEKGTSTQSERDRQRNSKNFQITYDNQINNIIDIPENKINWQQFAREMNKATSYHGVQVSFDPGFIISDSKPLSRPPVGRGSANAHFKVTKGQSMNIFTIEQMKNPKADGSFFTWMKNI